MPITKTKKKVKEKTKPEITQENTQTKQEELIQRGKAFWLVWNLNKNNPSFIHKTAMGAQNEAIRLSLKHNGELFFVVEAQASFTNGVPKNLDY